MKEILKKKETVLDTPGSGFSMLVQSSTRAWFLECDVIGLAMKHIVAVVWSLHHVQTMNQSEVKVEVIGNSKKTCNKTPLRPVNGACRLVIGSKPNKENAPL